MISTHAELNSLKGSINVVGSAQKKKKIFEFNESAHVEAINSRK